MNTPQKAFVGSLRVLLSTIGIAAVVLLTLLWARSYWWIDNVIGPQTGSFRPQMASSEGWLTIRYRNEKLAPNQFTKWKRQSTSVENMEAIYAQMEESIKNQPNATFSRPVPTFQFGRKEAGVFSAPYWLPIAAIGFLAIALGWKQDWRFSLKTMLTWTAVSAVCLVLAVQFFRI